jgi:hypothetical protein
MEVGALLTVPLSCLWKTRTMGGVSTRRKKRIFR